MDRPGDKSESESDSTREVRAGRKTGDEAAALAGQIGRITRASLPLAGGLRAMAVEG